MLNVLKHCCVFCRRCRSDLGAMEAGCQCRRGFARIFSAGAALFLQGVAKKPGFAPGFLFAGGESSEGYPSAAKGTSEEDWAQALARGPNESRASGSGRSSKQVRRSSLTFCRGCAIFSPAHLRHISLVADRQKSGGGVFEIILSSAPQKLSYVFV